MANTYNSFATPLRHTSAQHRAIAMSAPRTYATSITRHLMTAH